MKHLRKGTVILSFSVMLLTPTSLLAGDIKKGEKVFKKCAACHTITKNPKSKKIGPNLYGIVGAKVASNKDYAKKYSKALKEYGGTWTPERLAEFLEKPRKVVKKTRMTFFGLKKAKQRHNLIAYMNAQSDSPLALSKTKEQPKGENKTAKKEVAVKDEPSEFGVLVPGKGAEETYNNCTACHSERIVAQQGLTRKGWIEMFEWMVDEQEMEKMEEPDYTLVLDYLTKNYGEDRPNFPK